MAKPRQRWFWGLLTALGLVLLCSSTLSYCIFQRTPGFVEREVEAEGEENPTVLPSVPGLDSLDHIGTRLPDNVLWVVEIQGMRGLALELREEAATMTPVKLSPSLETEVQGLVRAFPFDTEDPLAWIRSGYDLTDPWGLGWVRDGTDDAGAWVLLIPIRSPEAARETTRSFLKAWELADRPVAWTWDANYHQIVIEEDRTRSPSERIQSLADATRENSFASASGVIALNHGLGGEWNLRLRCRDAGRSELDRIIGSSEPGVLSAWPFPQDGQGSTVGLAVRLSPEHQRMRVGLVGPALAAVRVNEGMGMESDERKELVAERIPGALGVEPSWRKSLHESGPAVTASLERVQVLAEIGPTGLVVDLRSSGRLDQLEPLIRWWTSLLK